MHKIFTSLVALICCLSFAQTSTAQVTFSVVPTDQQADIQIGDTVHINIDVEEFYDIASYQFSINWNSTWLNFESIPYLGLPNMSLGGNFGTNNVANGQLTTLWSAPGGGEYSLWDGDTTIFSVDFIVATTEGITAPILITGIPTGIEVIGLNGNGDLDDITSTAIFNNGTATVSSPGGGPTCNFGGGFGQIMDDASGETGDQVCLSVYACGFTLIEGMQYSINFDPALLQFASTSNHNLPDLEAGSFNFDNAAGWVVLSWVDPSGMGTTVADGEAIYDICFTIIGAGGNTADVEFTGTPLSIEVTDVASMGSPIPFNSDPGEVTITGTSGSAVTVVASNEVGEVGGQACIQVTALNFDTIVGAQYSMHWDTSIIKYASIGNFGGALQASDFNAAAALTNAGTLILQYIDFSNNGFSVDNGDTLYQVCFDVVGDIGEVSPFTFDGTPTSIEITQKVNGSDEIVPLVAQPGEVEVTGMSSGGTFTLTVSDEEVCPGDTVYIDYLASNFDSLVSMQYDATYDPAVLEYIGKTDVLPELNAMQFSNPSPGTVKMIWVEGGLNPISYFQDTVIYRLCFEAIGADGTNSTISWDYNATIEIGDGNTTVPYIFNDGSVSVTDNACDGLIITEDNITHVSCFGGNDGAIGITVTGGIPPYTYAWTPASSDEDLTNLTAGTYTVTVTDNSVPQLTNTKTFMVNEPAAAVSVTITPVDATCDGGSDGTATANPAGGTVAGAYQYSWDTNPVQTTQTASGLAAGQVCVTVTDDNGCSESACTTIGDGDAISITIDVVDSDCSTDSGTLTANPSGGSGSGYTYSWNTNPVQTTNPATGLAPGNYCVIVTDGDGCTEEQCADVGTLAGPSGSITNMVPTTCSTTLDGSLTVTPAGGTAPYTYVWNLPGQTDSTLANVPAGNYSVTITDASGCDDVVTGEITQGAGPSVSVTNGEASCDVSGDGELTANASNGTGPYNYAWDSGTGNQTTNPATGLDPGSYTVTITDTASGCTATASGTVTEGSGISANVADSQTNCSNSSDGELTVVPTNGTGTYNVVWNNAETTLTITDLPAGNYSVTVTDANTMCTAIADATVSNPSVVTASASVTSDYQGEDIACDGGSDGEATATPGGGTAPYSYTWSTTPQQTNQTATDLSAGTYTVTITDDNGCTATDQVSLTDPSPLSLSAAVTNEMAGGDGAIDLSVSGGTPDGGSTPYDYTWAPGGATTQDLSNLTEDEYCVTVTDDNGCTATECYTVNGPNSLDVTEVSVTDESCFESADGSIEVTQNGTGPWTYAWTGGLNPTNPTTGVGQGTYSVTVTDNNGVTGVLSSIVVGGPTDQITFTVDQSNALCNGGATGSIGLTLSGGNGAPYAVAWDNGGGAGSVISNLLAGSYTPTITDVDGCTIVGAPIVISQPDAMGVTLASTVDPGCNGELDGEVHINVSGGTMPYNYVWTPSGPNSPDNTGLGAGTYTCVVTDANGCIAATGQIILEVTGSPEITIDTQVNLACFDDVDGAITTTVTGGLAPYTYVWDGTTQTTGDISGLSGGNYFLTVTDVNGCSDTAGPINIFEPTPIILSFNTITPATLAGDDGAVIMNPPLGGTSPYTYLWSDGSTFLHLTGVPADTYTLTVTDFQGCTETITVTVGGTFAISSAVITDVSCAGNEDGAIDITIFGGVEPYQYVWNTPGSQTVTEDLTDIAAGNYCVTVSDANGLTTTGCYDVLGPDLLVISNFNVVHETGNGCNGSVGITVQGGTAPYTYEWSNGMTPQNITDLCKGDYIVTVTDLNGCMLISPPITILPPPISVVTTSATMASCAGYTDGQYCISVFGGCSPYTFVLNNGDSMSSITGQDVCFPNLSMGDYMLTISDSDGSTNTLDIVQSLTITEPDPIVVTTVSITNNTGGTNCNGAINISVAGGDGGPYDYDWSHLPGSGDPQDVDILCSVNNPYSVTVTDGNGCTGILEDLFVLDAPVVEGEVNNVSCLGECDGTITTTVNFGSGPYTYLWSPNGETTPSLSNLCAGEYSVTVTDAASVTTVAAYTVQAPTAELIINTVLVTNSNGTNADGCINIGVTGGWGNYTYEWSNGAESMDVCGLLGGLGGESICYTVTVTDANGEGCEAILTECITANEIYISASEVEEEDCHGDGNGYICIETTGGDEPHSYLWNIGGSDACIYDLGPGTYIVTVTDATGNLTNVFPFTLNGRDSLEVTFTTAVGEACATPFGGTAPYSYVWNNDDMDTTPCIEDQVTGEYSVVVSDANNCIVNDEVSITEEIDQECTEARTILTPNNDLKNEEFIILCARVFPVDLLVFNRWGQLVYEASNYDNTWRGTDLSGKTLPEGGYYYVVKFKDPNDGSDQQTKGYLTILIED